MINNMLILYYANFILLYSKLQRKYLCRYRFYHKMINCQQALIIVILTLMINLTRYLAISFPIYEFHQQAHMIPHPEKAHRGGQDAYFSNNELLVVADGVGGWNSYGIDPSKYSRFLCSKSQQLFKSNKPYFNKNPIQLIAQSSKLNQNLGSSTMVVLTLDGQILKTCYIGDSGFVIYRLTQKKNYRLYFQFKQQQHGFNFPFQLARKDYKGDDPQLSICNSFEIKQNDIIVAGSDGLFDNIYSYQILQLINKNHHDQQKLFSLKLRLAQLAIQRGKDNQFWSPFAQKAKQLNISYRGGKLDDTTIIISKIKKIKIQNQEEFSKFDLQIPQQKQSQSL